MERELSLQEIQKGSLLILKKIDKICRENNFRYFLIYGTLLGAVRHKNVIPWDDDVDIMMPRRDYNALLGYLAQHEEELYPLKVFNYQTNKKCPYAITRVADTNYRLVFDNNPDYGIGLFLDIYPLDYAGTNEEEKQKMIKKADRLRKWAVMASYKKVPDCYSKIGILLRLPYFLLAKIVGVKFFNQKLDQFARQNDYDKAKYVGCMAWHFNGEKEVFKKELVDQLIELELDGEQFYVPLKYDEILTKNYGDYMQLPPENERIAQHYYKAYRKEGL